MSDENRPKDDVTEDQDGAAKPADSEVKTASSPPAEAQPEADMASPEAVARRLEALGGDEEEDPAARAEERKLAERRAAQAKGKKKKKKKAGLEVAASKKLTKIAEHAEPKRRVAVAQDADPLIDQTAKLTEWLKKNQKVVQLVGGLLTVSLLGLAGYLWWSDKRETEASAQLSIAVETQRAPVGDLPKQDDDDDDDDELHFKTIEARRDAAIAKYREVETKYAGTGAAILARLAEGSLLLDKRDADGAIAAYEEVRVSALGKADKEVRGRALEGIGFAHEQKAFDAPAEAPKHLDAALEAYRELDGLDLPLFKELSAYHQARVFEAKGDKAKAKELLVGIKERLDKPDDTQVSFGPSGPRYPYLKEVAMDRLRALDPSAAPKVQGAVGGGAQLTPAQIQKLIEQQRKKAAEGHGDEH